MESHALLEEMDERMASAAAEAGAETVTKAGFQVMEGEKRDMAAAWMNTAVRTDRAVRTDTVIDRKAVTAEAAASGISAVTASKPLLYRAVKRLADILCSLGALIVLSPVFVVTAAAIRLEDGGPVFYVQKRNGLNGKVFRMYKFRSMCRNAEEIHKQLLGKNELDGPAFKLKDDPRVTGVGRFIRRTSIDELPQLVNIIKGEMSIVGPRPLPTYETEQCNDYQKQRLLVKPGLTCYWQICGRSDVPFDEWIEMDLKYIREAGVWVDFLMIVKTVAAVVLGKGAY